MSMATHAVGDLAIGDVEGALDQVASGKVPGAVARMIVKSFKFALKYRGEFSLLQHESRVSGDADDDKKANLNAVWIPLRPEELVAPIDQYDFKVIFLSDDLKQTGVTTPLKKGARIIRFPDQGPDREEVFTIEEKPKLWTVEQLDTVYCAMVRGG